MPMQERLIASVLVPAQTRPQKKHQAVLDSGGGGAVLFGIFAFIALAIALAMRQSNEQRQADIQRMEVRQQQNKAQEAEEAKKIQIGKDWKESNISLIQKRKHVIYKNYWSPFKKMIVEI